MKLETATVLHQPGSAALRFLPEGPYPWSDGWISWVAIQHGAESRVGSLNLLSLETGENRSIELPGRPGFAFPTRHPQQFVVGLEREVVLIDSDSGRRTVLCDGIDGDVDNTIINDGVAFDAGLVFGCKDLEFQTQKAGLYFYRSQDRRVIRLRDDQVCSNGKVIIGSGPVRTLIDIDSPTKTVVRYQLSLEDGRLSEPEVVLDFTDGDVFPDGMVATPDEQSVIIAFYNPQPAEAGEARQFSLSTGECEAVWRVPGSPQVTCPQLVATAGGVRLILTTAVEHMSAEQQAAAPQAGCLFQAPTDFTSTPPTPRFELPDGTLDT